MNQKKMKEPTAQTEIRYPFRNHIIFAMVMEDPQLCKALIERILPDRKIQDIRVHDQVDHSVEAVLFPGLHAKSVRLDVRFVDSESWYDIEMQVAPSPALAKRARYYSSAGDIVLLRPGEPYEKLRASFVIFLCCFDAFGLDEPMYIFERYDKNLHLPLEDASYIIMVNTVCSERKVPPRLRDLFQYINHSEVKSGDAFIRQLDERVRELQNQKEVRQSMTLEEHYAAIYYALESQKSALENQNSDLETKNSALETEITMLTQKIADLESELRSLKQNAVG